ncbi:MAG: aminotransferase class V-fold PLP-dependent enzyme [Thaumarchaeota archaeon]|nr:aminotransferase class V-fold PLP-dependent enzyme [Nitrososphaerota archaeon]
MKIDDVIDEEFPIARKLVYLNTAGVGLIPKSVVNSITSYFRRTLTIPPYEELFHEYGKLVEDARREFGRLIAASRDEVAFQTNTSTSTNSVVQMLGWKKGDNAVFDDLGFPSDTYPLIALRGRGVDARMARSKGGYVGPEEFERLIDKKTKLVMLSLVSWINGMRSDVEGIARIAKERGALVMVDSTHGTGYLDINVKRWRVDFLATSNYKWLLSPFGTSEFYCAREHLEEFEPPQVGWHSVRRESKTLDVARFEHAKNAKRFEAGNPDYVSIFGLIQSLRFLSKVGHSVVRRRTLKLAGQTIEGLEELGFRISTPREERRRSAIVFASLEGMDGAKLAGYFRKKGVWVTARRYGRLSGIRLSPYFYTSEDDVQEFLNAASEIARKT